MLQLVGELERVGPAVGRERLPGGADIREILDAGTKLPHLPIGAEVNVTGRTAASLLELAEMQREAELLFVRQRLVAEHQNGVLGHVGMDGRNLVRRQRPPAIDTRDFAGEGGAYLPDRFVQMALPRDADRKTGGANGGTISTDPRSDNWGTGSASAPGLACST
jgi:hypothetical protein